MTNNKYLQSNRVITKKNRKHWIQLSLDLYFGAIQLLCYTEKITYFCCKMCSDYTFLGLMTKKKGISVTKWRTKERPSCIDPKWMRLRLYGERNGRLKDKRQVKYSIINYRPLHFIRWPTAFELIIHRKEHSLSIYYNSRALPCSLHNLFD